MKRITTTLSFLVLTSVFFGAVHAQPQRLLVLGALEGAAQTVCIDYFADIPAKTDVLRKVIPIREGVQGPNLSLRGTGQTNSAKIIERGLGEVGGNPFIVGTDNASGTISRHYSDFLENRVQAFKQSAKSVADHDRLQQEIWEYDVLNHLGYMKQGKEPVSDYMVALRTFQQDVGQNSAGDLLEIAADIKDLVKANAATGEDYQFLYVSKNQSNGNYVVFDGLKKPIYIGPDKRQLVNVLNGIRDGDNIHIELNGFASGNSEEAFLTDIRTQFRLQRDITVETSRFNPVCFSDNLQHRINPNEISRPIRSVATGDGDFFRGSVSIQTTTTVGSSDIFVSEAIALSKNRTAVETFVNTIRTRLSGPYRRMVLANSISSIKRYVVSSTGIPSTQLYVLLKNEIGLSSITSTRSETPLLIAQK